MATSRTDNERALALRREVGDRWAIGVSENNLGMIALHDGEFDAAREHFETSMRLNREVGDAWMVAIGHNNLGDALRSLLDRELATRRSVKLQGSVGLTAALRRGPRLVEQRGPVRHLCRARLGHQPPKVECTL